MSQLSLTLARAHHNRQLFSNWFLEERLRRDSLWTDAAAPAAALRGRLRAQYDRVVGALGPANEAQTEERWIRPVLRELGWGFEVQARSRRQTVKLTPDYALFRTESEATAAASAVHDDPRAVFKRAVGVLEAKRWNRDLDARGAGPEDGMVPSAQIINYLIRTEQAWGVLTNGVEWRIYLRDADFADSVYFGLDLVALLGDDPLPLGETNQTVPAEEAFRYFYLFFQPEAFTPGPDGRRRLDLARDSSTRYARGVEEVLKPRAYRAVTALVRGFAAADRLDHASLAQDSERCGVMLDNALTLLFRLLFVLYAESRDLLPLRTNAAYRAKSLLSLRERIARARDQDTGFFPRGRDLWNDVHDLFRIIDGAPEWQLEGVPVYNGGLFDRTRHPWLEEHYVADPYFAEALDLMSRVEDPDDERIHFVDFSPLDVRHLGSIYEGLLEYIIRVAAEDLPEITERGRIVRDPVRRGELYLATDRGERKATGSFYTPDYIVQYIVDRTLRPLVDGKTVEELLALRVLDPAMGSGHFLVAATSYLARAAVGSVERAQQLTLDGIGELSPDHLRRLVVERCIFGVDKNPRAVELAKLALWLATVQFGKALNFLDHHLRGGDSLIGARLRLIGTYPRRRGRELRLEREGQVGVFDDVLHRQMLRALASLDAITTYLSDTPDQVHTKEQLFAAADRMLARLRDVADLWTSAWFSDPADDALTDAERASRSLNADRYDGVLALLRAGEGEWSALLTEPWFQRAKGIAARERFFHWELEYAPAFFDADGEWLPNPGFDAVVGNPPYVRMEEFSGIKDFLRVHYRTYETRSDLYVYFVERSLDLLQQGGEYGAIVSNKFLRAKYGRPLRTLMTATGTVREIVDLGGLPVFPEATVRAAILLVARSTTSPGRTAFAELRDLNPATFEASVSSLLEPLDPEALSGEEWLLASDHVARVFSSLTRDSTPLSSYLGPHTFAYGIKSGLDEAFVVSDATYRALIRDDEQSRDALKPYVSGASVRRYYIEHEGRWLIYLPAGASVQRFPAIERHLSAFRQRLEGRATAHSHAWYELQQPQRVYSKCFDGPKILYPDIASTVRFAVTTASLYPATTCFAVCAAPDYILALVNSKLGEFFIRHTAAKLEGGTDESQYLRFKRQYVERFPIRRQGEATPAAARAELGSWLRSLYSRGLRLAGIEPAVPDEIRTLGKRLGALEGVERVILVGSWARGEARDDSDVDLFVLVTPNGSASRHRARLLAALGRVDRPLDLHVYTPDELDARAGDRATFEAHALSEGLTLYPGA